MSLNSMNERTTKKQSQHIKSFAFVNRVSHAMLPFSSQLTPAREPQRVVKCPYT